MNKNLKARIEQLIEASEEKNQHTLIKSIERKADEHAAKVRLHGYAHHLTKKHGLRIVDKIESNVRENGTVTAKDVCDVNNCWSPWKQRIAAADEKINKLKQDQSYPIEVVDHRVTSGGHNITFKLKKSSD